MLKKERLFPDRHKQNELFLCDIGDAAIKDDMGSMEHPMFALSTKPDTKPRRYVKGNTTVDVEPGSRGMATIYDKDILIFAISQIMAAKKKGLPYTQELAFTAHDLLVFTNRQTNGQAYEGLKDALARLDGTRVRTTVMTGGEETWNAFGLIEKATIRKEGNGGRVVEWGIKLSDWLFRAIEADEVLTMHPDYFRLRKPLDRRIYEIARKHCGMSSHWLCGLEKLHQKSGSSSALNKFRFQIKEMCKANLLPDYEIQIDEKGIVRFDKRASVPVSLSTDARLPSITLKEATIHQARGFLDGWCPYAAEADWKKWLVNKGVTPDNPDALYLSFCKTWKSNQGSIHNM